MANRINREAGEIREHVEQAARLAREAKGEAPAQETKRKPTKSYSLRMPEETRNKIAGVFQQAGGVNFTDALTQSALFVVRSYEQGKLTISKNGIFWK